MLFVILVILVLFLVFGKQETLAYKLIKGFMRYIIVLSIITIGIFIAIYIKKHYY